jgi:hypothetical protein
VVGCLGEAVDCVGCGGAKLALMPAINEVQGIEFFHSRLKGMHLRRYSAGSIVVVVVRA